MDFVPAFEMFNQSIKTFWSLIYLFVSKQLPLEMMNCSVRWLISFRSWKKSLFHDMTLDRQYHNISPVILMLEKEGRENLK